MSLGPDRYWSHCRSYGTLGHGRQDQEKKHLGFVSGEFSDLTKLEGVFQMYISPYSHSCFISLDSDYISVFSEIESPNFGAQRIKVSTTEDYCQVVLRLWK